jgi:hypothetical protein
MKRSKGKENKGEPTIRGEQVMDRKKKSRLEAINAR